MDYIELWFEGYTLTALADPILVQEGNSHHRQNAGYNDLLIGKIGKRVNATRETDEDLTLDFGDTQIIIPLNPDDPPGPELAMMSGPERFLAIWLRKVV